MYEIAASNVNSIAILTKSQYESYNPPANPVDSKDNKIPLIYGGGDWWLTDAGEYSRYIYVVHDGRANKFNGVVNNQGTKVRPILNLKSSIVGGDRKIGSEVLFGNTEWIIIANTVVICKDCIGRHAFMDDWHDKTAQTYSSSSLKKFLDDWLAYWKA